MRKGFFRIHANFPEQGNRRRKKGESKKPSIKKGFFNSPSKIRTYDQRINSPLLYRWAIEEYENIIAW